MEGPGVKFAPQRATCYACRSKQQRGTLPSPEDFEITEDAEAVNAAAERTIQEQKHEQAARERAQRLASDTAPLKPGDADGETFSAERARLYSENMGDFAVAARDPEKLAEYISTLAEQERRYTGRRIARSVSIGAARDLLFCRQFEQIAQRVHWPVPAEGYAKRQRMSAAKRMVTLTLSDLHIGAMLPKESNPEAYDFVAAGRRLAHLAIETAEFKTRHRDQTSLNLCFNGDIIEGMLNHADFDNARFPEQMVAAGRFMVAVVRYEAAHFPSVDVYGEPGNHGRIFQKYPGRNVSMPWDSYEVMLYQFVRDQCRHLPNVRWHIPKAAAVVVPLFDRRMFLTHGDTEIKLKAPSASGGKASWGAALAKLNAERKWCAEPIDILAAGHFHDPDTMYFAAGVGLANGALVPPNGYARAGGLGDGVCGQFLFESVPGRAFGDSRFLRVGPEQDCDGSLDDVVPRYSWDDDALPPLA